MAVARAGSVNAAAREVGVSQQAASARLASMEALTGVRLLVRSPRGSTLTDAGSVVVEWAARLLAGAQQLDAGLATLRGEARARVRVSASLTVAEHLLPSWLVSLQAAALGRGTPPPEVVLTATNSDTVLARVLAGDADLGFIESPRRLRGVRSRLVARDELVLVVRPDHPWVRRRRVVTAVELGATALVSREQGSGTRDALDRALSLAVGGRQVAPVLALSTTAAVRGAVRAGAGPAVLSRLAVQDDLADGRLVRVDVAELDLRRALRAVWVGPPQPPAGAVRDLVSHITGLRGPSNTA